MALQAIGKPSFDVVKLDEMKKYLVLEDDYSNETVAALIRTAHEEVTKYLNKAVAKQEFIYSLDSLPGAIISIPKPPLISIKSLKIYDDSGNVATVSVNDYYIDVYSSRLILRNTFQNPFSKLREVGAYEIDFYSGYSTVEEVPECIKTAIKLYVSFRFENPECSEMSKAFYNLIAYERIKPV